MSTFASEAKKIIRVSREAFKVTAVVVLFHRFLHMNNIKKSQENAMKIKKNVALST